MTVVFHTRTIRFENSTIEALADALFQILQVLTALNDCFMRNVANDAGDLKA